MHHAVESLGEARLDAAERGVPLGSKAIRISRLASFAKAPQRCYGDGGDLLYRRH